MTARVALVRSHFKEKPATGMHTGHSLWVWITRPTVSRAESRAGRSWWAPWGALTVLQLGRLAGCLGAARSMRLVLPTLRPSPELSQTQPWPRAPSSPNCSCSLPLSFPDSMPTHILHCSLCLGVCFWEAHQIVWPFTLSHWGAHREDVSPRP